VAYERGALLLDRYEVLDAAGAGSGGGVYRTLDRARGATVALKSVAGLDAESARRLRAEFRALARLRHPSIARVLDLGEHGGAPFFTAEWVPGPTLRAARLDERALERALLELASALAHAHERGVLHNDVSPENVVVAPDRAVLVDFGLSGPPAPAAVSEVGGTLATIAPEKLRGEPYDGRADLYSLGATIYEALTGRAPFTGTAAEVIRGHLERAPALPEALAAGVPARLARLALRLLAKDPLRRPRSARELAEEMRRWGIEEPRRPLGPEDVPEPALAGREAALARLRARPTPVVLVTGARGAGKSRFLEEVRERLLAEGARVALASGAEGGGALGPVAALARLSDAAPPPAAGGHPHEALARAFFSAAAASPGAPLALLVDDAGLAGPEAQEALAHLARAFAQRARAGLPAPALLALAFETRPSGARLDAGTPPLEIGLGPLDEAGTAALLRDALSRRDPPSALATRVRAATGGVPRRITALLRRLAAAGALAWERGEVGVDERILERVAAAAERDAALLGAEQEGPGDPSAGPIPEEARRAARALAVIGRPASVAEVAAALEAPLDEARAGLLRLAARGLVSAEEADRATRYRFPGGGAARAVYEGTPQRERRALHAAWLAALEGGAAGEAGPDAEERARHAIASGSVRLARRHVGAAAARLSEEGRSTAASRLLEAAAGLESGPPAAALLGRAASSALAAREHERAAALLDAALAAGGDALEAGARADLHIDRSSALSGRGDLDGAARALEAAGTALAALGAPDPLRAAAHLRALAQIAVARGRFAEARDLARRGLDALPPSGAGAERPASALHNLLALASFHLGDRDAAAEGYRRALDLARRSGHRVGEANILLNLGVLRLRAGDPEAGVAYSRRALRLAEEAGDPELAASVANNLGNRAHDRGELDEARRLFREALEVRERLGQPGEVALLLNNLGSTDLAADDALAAEDRFRRALELAERAGAAAALALARANIGRALAARGRLAEALAALERSLEERRRSGDRTRVAIVLAELSRVERALGRRERATAAAEEAIALEPADPAAAWAARLAREEAQAAEDPAGAAARIAGARDALRALGLPRPEAEAGVALARAHLALGDSALAASVAARAAEVAGRVGARRPLALARIVLSRAALAERAPDRALDQARAAAAIARDLADPEVARRAALALADALLALGRADAAARERASARRAARAVLDALPPGLAETYRRRRSVALALEAGGDDASGEAAGPPPRADAAGAALALIRRILHVDPEDETGLLEATLDGVLEIAGAARGFLLMAGAGPGAPPSVEIARDALAGRLDRPADRVSRSLVAHVLRTGEPRLVADAQADPLLAGSASVARLALGSVIAAPVPWRGEVIGALVLERPAPPFGAPERDLVVALAREVAGAVRLGRHQLEQRRALDGLRAELEGARSRLAPPEGPAGLVGRSPAMQEVHRLVARFAASDLSVAISGESGAGKERVARALHESGPRAGRPFVAVSCTALAGGVLEAELFGVVRGAFTGASEDRPGLLVLAEGGTIFLDDVSGFPAEAQAKLLRAIDERAVRPVGGGTFRRIDARFLCASKEPLEELVAAGRFRDDLYYRLAGVQIRVPPLRERPEDIPLLAERFLAEMSSRDGRSYRLSRAAAADIARHPWPGNVRELRNALERAALLASRGAITSRALDLGGAAAPPPASTGDAGPLRPIALLERDAVLAALRRHRTRSAAARALGVSRPTLYRKMRAYGFR
jgi:DNA-binding NtrC family response regulator/tetratricopeptide (TPR) repeat protein